MLMKNKWEKLLKWGGLGAVITIPAVALGVIGNYFYRIAVSRSEKPFLKANEDFIRQGSAEQEARAEAYQKTVDEWVKKNPPVNMHITVDGGVRLHAIKFINHAAGHKWAIVVHGYASGAMNMVPHAREFFDRGFHVLAPDCRGHGQSEGEYIGMGWHDRLDMVRWIGEIVRIDPEARIVLYGLSMGAATVMMTAGEDLPGNVACVIEDCGYSSIKDEFAHQLTNGFYRLPRFPILGAFDIVCRIKAGYSVKDGNAIRQVKKCKIPILFIHGEQDDFVPFAMVHELYEAAPGEKQLFTVPGAGHGMSWIVDPVGYWRAIDGFLLKYM